MNLNEAFPSAFIGSEDVADKTITLTIKDADIEEVGQTKERKLVLTFKATDKKMICNKTNANRIAELYGQDTDDWIGKKITLGTEPVTFQGKTQPGLRVVMNYAATPAPVAANSSGESPDDPRNTNTVDSRKAEAKKMAKELPDTDEDDPFGDD